MDVRRWGSSLPLCAESGSWLSRYNLHVNAPLTMRPMTEEEWLAFAEHTVPAFAHELVKAGMTPQQARKRADESFAQLMPDGRLTAGQHVFVAEADGQRVGHLWLGERDDGPGGPELWVYDIETDDAFRRRGFGREMMRLAEEHARGLGDTAIALNVFDTNLAARRLYESLGYAVTGRRPGSTHMTKSLT